jgi:hypothetical protein
MKTELVFQLRVYHTPGDHGTVNIRADTPDEAIELARASTPHGTSVRFTGKCRGVEETEWQQWESPLSVQTYRDLVQAESEVHEVREALEGMRDAWKALWWDRLSDELDSLAARLYKAGTALDRFTSLYGTEDLIDALTELERTEAEARREQAG